MVSSKFNAFNRLLVTPTLVVGLLLSARASSGADQPVRQLYLDAKTNAPLLNRSFSTYRPQGSSNLDVYLFPSDVELALDKREFRPDAMIMPTNDELLFEAEFPGTQKLLVGKLKRDSTTFERVVSEAKSYMKDRKKLIIATDAYYIQLKPNGAAPGTVNQPFPSFVCLIATDEKEGGSIAVKFTPLLTQFKVKEGIQKCLAWLDAQGVKSVVMPLIGSRGGTRKGGSLTEENERKWMQCRHLNSIAGIGLGISDFLPKLNHIQEIGVVQYTGDLKTMFPLLYTASHTGTSGELRRGAGTKAYNEYAAYASKTFQKALVGTAAPPPPREFVGEVNCNDIYTADPAK